MGGEVLLSDETLRNETEAVEQTDQTDHADEKLKLKAPRRIVLKKTVEGGSIRQSFPHGRSKSVVVEVRRKKTFVKADVEEDTASRPGSPLPDAGTPVVDQTVRQEHADHPVVPTPGTLGTPDMLDTGPGPETTEVAGSGIAGPPDAPAKEPIPVPALADSPETSAVADTGTVPAPAPAEMAVSGEAQPVVDHATVTRTTPVAAAPSAGESIAPPAAVTTDRSPPSPSRAPVAGPSTGSPDPAGKPAYRGTAPGGTAGRSFQPASRPTQSAVPSSPAPMGGAAGIAAGKEKKEPVREATAKEKEDAKRKPTKQQREDLARKKTEDLVVQRLAQVEDLRLQKRIDDERRHLLVEEVAPVVRREVARPKVKGRTQGEHEDIVEEEVVAPRRPIRMRRDRRRQEPTSQIVRDVIVPESITVGELANRMAVKATDVIRLLMEQGVMANINQMLDQDTAAFAVEGLGHRVKRVSVAAEIDAELAEVPDLPEQRLLRPPVVTVMGHVDHGKTSLLDAIRQTDVTSREFGGITQHIGAYQVTIGDERRITFLDTPGHEAFTAMRARGAKATDLVILVVAADDGVMPQTIEAINHAKDASVPILVALNKIDRPDANPDRVMQQLSDRGLVPEDWGGETIYVKVSAKTGEGIDLLQEMVVLQSEVLDLRANPNKRARGVIIESNLDRGRGAVATCLVQNGTLRVGDAFVVGHEWGKVRGLYDDRGQPITEAVPATPVEVVGLSGVPRAGDELVVVADERRAREIAGFRHDQYKEQEQIRQAPAKLDDIFEQIRQGESIEIKVVVKGDVQGSVEAVADALRKIPHEKVGIHIIHTGVGGITESDVMLAVASDAIVVGFNVRADVKARELAKREQVELRFYNIIYDLVDDIVKAMEGLLQPTLRETVTGHAQVREVFRISRIGNVAGCLVTDGVIGRKSHIRLLRDNVVIHEGVISALKRFKDDVKEVRLGMECGLSLDKFSDIKAGDVLESFTREEVKQTIGG
jgi:translation initiation factor IF-2